MRTSIAAGNWKMNYGPGAGAIFARNVVDALNAITSVQPILFPPFITIPAVREIIGAAPHVELGAQDVATSASGAYTGEVAAGMIAELCQWVIVGHSERRALFNESDATVNRKLLTSLEAGLNVIVCVGERLADREASLTEAVINAQIRGSLARIPANFHGHIAIAYEPIWAIGTGRASAPEDAEAVAKYIRTVYAELYGTAVSDTIRILYGGSVTSGNVVSFMRTNNIDGALVGGASLTSDFVEITRLIAQTKQQ